MRKNPHVRICGGLGSATTLVYPTLAAAYAAHPERFVNGQPKPADLPQAVWINPPEKKTAAQDAPETTSGTSVDLQDPLISRSREHSAATTIDLGATLITSPLVSQCH